MASRHGNTVSHHIPLLLFYALATYRLALMLSSDTGPWLMFSKLRSWLKREAKKNSAVRASAVHHGITCIRCDSVWVAIPISAYAWFHDKLPAWFAATGDIFLAAMALSAIAIILNRAFPPA